MLLAGLRKDYDEQWKVGMKMGIPRPCLVVVGPAVFLPVVRRSQNALVDELRRKAWIMK